MSTTQTHIGIGIGVFVLNKSNKFLLGERLGSLGSSTHGLPGGHLEIHETFEACASRELHEETSILIPPSRMVFLTATNQPDLEGRHYVTIFMGCRLEDGEGEARRMEPEKCGGWEWVGWEEMRADWEGRGEGREEGRRRLFRPLYDLFEQRGGFNLEGALGRRS